MSAAESACSHIWTRYCLVIDDKRPCELSCRICGREVSLSTIDEETASRIATDGLPPGCGSSVVNGVITNGCCCCGG
jgi:hypothetical protein